MRRKKTSSPQKKKKKRETNSFQEPFSLSFFLSLFPLPSGSMKEEGRKEGAEEGKRKEPREIDGCGKKWKKKIVVAKNK